MRNELARTHIGTTERVDAVEVAGLLGDLGQQADGWLAGEGVDADAREVSYVIDMRYYRQGFELPVDLEAAELDSLDLEVLADRFRELHDRLYGFSLPGSVEVVNLRARALGRVTKPSLPEHELAGADASSAQVGTHGVWRAGEQLAAPLYDRAALTPGMQFGGFAIVTQYDATTVVLPGHIASVDRWENLIIEPAA